jgi:hypothetical protein
MISMILLVQHVAEANEEDGARPKVTGGPSITPIMQRPGIISFFPYRVRPTTIKADPNRKVRPAR